MQKKDTTAYQSTTLPNGLRVVALPRKSNLTYCGVVIDVGARDEEPHQYGMAHFIEHMLFKGTAKRKSGHIINRLEDVGGELNAYTTKEETVVHATVLTEHSERAIELIADMVQNSTFPQKEITKEVEIILEEIESYNDSPTELIYDDFEDIIFENTPLAHNILGTKKHLLSFNTERTQAFFSQHYQVSNMILFATGDITLNKLVRWATKHFTKENHTPQKTVRNIAKTINGQQHIVPKNNHQVHCLIGNSAYSLYHENRIKLILLNNIVGGMGMNSILNLNLREKNGLVYTAYSTYQAFTDTGWWNIYFGTDKEKSDKCLKIIMRELKKLREKTIVEKRLNKHKQQLMGQLAIATDNNENIALSLAKSILRFGHFENIDEIKTKIEKITPLELQNIANEIFDPKSLSMLKYDVSPKETSFD